MAKASPLQIVKDRFGDKAKLIEKLAALVETQGGESADEHKRRLRNVSNAKLLHLLALGEKAKELGGREAIVKKILELKNQPKDHEYGDKLKKLPLGKLVDLFGSIQRAAKSAGKAAKTAAKKTTRSAPAKGA